MYFFRLEHEFELIHENHKCMKVFQAEDAEGSGRDV